MIEPARSIEDRARTLGYLLWELSSRMTVLGEAALSETQLSMPALGLLQRIHERPGVTLAELARDGIRTAQALSQIAARLDKLGYLERRLAGGRGIGLHVTESGERARQRGLHLEAAFESGLATQLGPDTYTTLRDLLEHSRPVIRDLDQHRRDNTRTPGQAT